MSKSSMVFGGILAGLLLVFLFVWLVPSMESLAAARGQPAMDVGLTPSSDEGVIQPGATPTRGDEASPPEAVAQADQPQALPTPVPGDPLLYFLPTDNDATATVLYLYNTADVTRTVLLRGFSYNGLLVYSLNITMSPTSFQRLASDSIATAPPPSWATPAPLITISPTSRTWPASRCRLA